MMTVSTTFSRLLSALACALLIAGCNAGAEEAAPPTDDAPHPVRTVEADQRRRALPLQTSGRLNSKAEIQLSFKISGIVQRIHVDEGDRVERGQTLAQLDLSEINARVVEAESALEKAKRDLDRAQMLYRDSAATLEDVQNAKTQVDISRAQMQSAQFNKTHAVIKAPDDGRILRRVVEEGELVQPSTPAFTLGAVGRGWVVRVGLPARDVVRLSRSDTAEVRFNAYPERTFDARVTEIADAADPATGTFEVEMTVDDPERLLKSGFIGRVRLYPSDAPTHVVVPAEALVQGDGDKGVVFVLHDGRVERRRVRVAQLADSTVVLADGLDAGTTVVTSGAPRLADGDSVRVLTDR